jgi:hypothetical protein
MGINSNTFDKDLQFGKIYEYKLMEYIPHKEYTVVENEYFPDYDVKVVDNEDKITYYEVKADRIGYKTGNLIIEFNCRNRPSGIALTKANYYAYFVIKPYNIFQLYIIPVSVIKNAIEEKLYKRIMYCGTKEYCTGVYVFDSSIFEQYRL